MDIIVCLGPPAAAQLAAALENSELLEVKRKALQHLGPVIVALLETDGDARKPYIDKKMKAKIDAQNEYFNEKHRKKVAEREERRRVRRAEAREKDLLTPDDSDHDLPPESENGVEEDE